MALHVESFPVAPLGCNCSIVADLEAKVAIVVDPGGELPKIRARLEALGVVPTHVVHTHTHIDHVGATPGLVSAYGCTAQIHEADRPLYDMLPVQAAMLGIAMPETTHMDGALRDGGTVNAGASELGVIHTPGHTPGSVCFLLTAGDDRVLFAGDTLFRRSIGRTDLWGGDSDLILSSIRERILTLEGDTLVVTGHGPTTRVVDEREKNPFLR
jgi:hydroxyacylglutathione hydrolase